MRRTARCRPAATAPGAPPCPGDPSRAARTGAWAVALLAGLVLAGCASTTAGSGEPAPDLAAGAGSPTAGPSPTVPAGSSRPVRFGTLTVPVPAGAVAKADGTLLCLTLQGDARCSLEILDVGRTLDAGGSVSAPAPGEPNGWWWGPGAPTCGEGGSISPVTASTVVDKGFRPLGDKTAAYGSWQVSCADPGLSFSPRLWWLPTSRIAFRQRSTAAGSAGTVDRILAAVTFG